MSLGLTKPGASVALRHPKTGAILAPIGFLKNGTAVWPVLGAASDDPDDPSFTGGGDPSPRGRVEDDDDEDDTDEDDKDDDEDKKPVKKSKKDDEDDEDDKPSRPERQAARYRTRLREAERRERELAERLRKLEDGDKPQDEVLSRDLQEVREQNTSLSEVNRILTSQLAFFKSNEISWVDSTDAFNLAEKEGLFDDVIDEDGNVDTRELRRGLKDLAKRKPHLVNKSTRGRQDEKDTDDEGPSPRSSSTMNGNRRGAKGPNADRTALAKRFPVLGNR